MKLFDFEIELSKRSIYDKKSLIKMCYWGINTNGALIIFLSIFAYYFNSFNWLNGFAIGINLFCLMDNIGLYRIAKIGIEVSKARIALYEEIKKQLAQQIILHEQAEMRT